MRTLSDGAVAPPALERLLSVVLSLLDNTVATVRATADEVRETLGTLPKPAY